jgi:hypothetical protein
MNAPSKVEKAKKPSGTIAIHGREYQTVAFRVQRFREAHPDWGLLTSVVERDGECVVVQAQIENETGRILATGHAEEYRKASQINRTSALENAETSAIGRALAALGFGGTEFATANEVANAIHQQGNPATGETPPNKRVKLDGAYSSPTALRGALKTIVHNIEGFGELDEFIAYVESAEVMEAMAQCRRDMPDWWEGGDNMPAEFEPLEARLTRRKRELEEIETLRNRQRSPIDAG